MGELNWKYRQADQANRLSIYLSLCNDVTGQKDGTALRIIIFLLKSIVTYYVTLQKSLFTWSKDAFFRTLKAFVYLTIAIEKISFMKDGSQCVEV